MSVAEKHGEINDSFVTLIGKEECGLLWPDKHEVQAVSSAEVHTNVSSKQADKMNVSS